MHRLSSLLLPLSAALLIGAAGAAPASAAATLTTSASCYQATQDVVVDGAGFAPGSAVTISRDGTVLGTAQADGNGAFRNKFATPKLPDDVREREYALSATDVVNTATTTYRAARIFATFRPRTGDPATLRVRFTVTGFGLVKRNAPIYLHYVQPGGRLARTIRLGSAGGPCGTIERTRLRRLFGFDARQGDWILQFDTRPKYERATGKRRTPWVRKPVEIFSRTR